MENAFTRKPPPMTKKELREFNISYSNRHGGQARAKNTEGVAVKLSGTKPERKAK